MGHSAAPEDRVFPLKPHTFQSWWLVMVACNPELLIHGRPLRREVRARDFMPSRHSHWRLRWKRRRMFWILSDVL